MITYDEVRYFLSAQTTISSNLGMVLDRMREGRTTGSGDVRYAQAKDENMRLRTARVIRCIDGLQSVSSIRFARHHFGITDLRKFAWKTGLGDGETVVLVLRRYEPWSSQWPEKGLAEVYQWARSKHPELRALKVDGDEAAQAFRMGKYPGARQYASALVADAHVALGEWVRIFSSKEADRDRRRTG